MMVRAFSAVSVVSTLSGSGSSPQPSSTLSRANASNRPEALDRDARPRAMTGLADMGGMVGVGREQIKNIA